MNCKPGDLAVIVDSSQARSRSNIGLLVSVRELCEGSAREWKCDPVPGQRPPLNGDGHPIVGWVGVYDRNLHPIRDPGDDAVDQTLLWLPVPSEKEPA